MLRCSLGRACAPGGIGGRGLGRRAPALEPAAALAAGADGRAFLPPLRMAPRRWELPGHQRASRSRRAVASDQLGPVGVSSTAMPARARAWSRTASARRSKSRLRAPGLRPCGSSCARTSASSAARQQRPRGCPADAPVRCKRVHAEHVGHGDDGAGGGEGRLVVALVEGGVAGAHGVVHDGERATARRGRRPSRRRRPPGRSAAAGPARSRRVGRARSRKPSMRSTAAGGLVEGAGVVLDHRAVVRGGEVVAQHDRPRLLEQVTHLEGVAERLAHLLALDRDPRVVQPVAGEAETGRTRLRLLVLVVREAQVDAAAVDVELVAELAPRHRRALEVPARAAGAERRRPRRAARARRPCAPSTGRSRAGRACPAGRRRRHLAMSSSDWLVSEPYSGQERTSK